MPNFDGEQQPVIAHYRLCCADTSKKLAIVASLLAAAPQRRDQRRPATQGVAPPGDTGDRSFTSTRVGVLVIAQIAVDVPVPSLFKLHPLLF
ncbi:hypothetical protein GQ600_9620 [Phytophthora cactorum]|nr:hypothetical protein GQ600_9620 [Phytophthora cactorum]